MKMIRRTALVVATVVVLGPALGAEVVQQILVKVNGEIFTKTDLEQRQIAAIRQMQGADAKDPSDTQLRQMLDQATPQLLVNIVDEVLMIQRGHELGYRMADDQFQSILDNIKKENKLESDEQFQAALKQENMTLPELRKSLERQMIVSRVQQNEVIGRIAVSDDEARRYYDTHLPEFTTTPTVTLREIFVNFANATTPSVADDTNARQKAEAIRARAVAGESYEKLAADLSDAPSRANAGLIGPLSLSDLSPDVRKLLEPMKAGELTQPLRGPRGYQLLKLESRSQSETKSFGAAREDISNRVFTTKRQAEFQKYLEKLRAEAIIEWKNQDLKKAYDEGIAQAKTTALGPDTAPRQ